MKFNRPGLIWVTAALLFVGGWRLLAIVCQAPHLLDKAAEIGSIAQGREGVVPNHDGTSAVYNMETEDGVGVYLYDVVNGESHFLADQRESGMGTGDNRCRMLDWSPDGRVVAYYFNFSYTNNPPPKTIVLYDGSSGEIIGEIPAEAYAPDSQFVWLSANSFVYSAYQHRSWLVFSRKADGRWTESNVVKRFADGRLADLTVISPTAIAWMSTNSVWTYDFTSSKLKEIWQTTNWLAGFACDDRGDYVFNCIDAKGPFAIRYRPPRIFENEGSVLDVTRNPGRARYADKSVQDGLYTFALKLDGDSNPRTFTWDGMLVNQALCGDSLFLMGNQADSAPGVWQYNVRSNSLGCLVSGLHGSLKYATIVPYVSGLITNSEGKEIAYRLWPPSHFVLGKKYPIIFGQLYGWTLDPEAAANAGFYFAGATLSDWSGSSAWAEDVMGVYQALAQNPNVDTNRVYFIAYSAQCAHLDQILGPKVNSCEGLILFHPTEYPDLSKARVSKILLIGGTDDSWAPADKLADFQNQMVRRGISVDYFLQKGVRHVNNSIATERDQAVQLARFLAEKR